MKTILITGIGGLTPRSIAKIIRKNHPNYKLIGIDVNKKAIGFFIKGLLDDYSVSQMYGSRILFFHREVGGRKKS